MKDLIRKYVEAYGPSGQEDQVRALVLADIDGLADTVQVDALGNVLATVNPRPANSDGKTVLLMAHMDEIGLMVTHIDKQGFCRFTTVGGIFPTYAVGQRVKFANGTIGVVGAEYRKESQADLSVMFIDVGASGPDDCPVAVGDTAHFWQPMAELNDHRLVAKSMDDRIAVAILIETLKRLEETPHTVVFAFSVQEEVGLRGAGTAAYGVDPDIGIALDVTRTGDIPRHGRMEVGLGKGPAIKVRDSGMLADPRVVRLMRQRAEDAGLPYQMEILDGGTTDARAMQVSRAGVPAGCISIPCRHIHSPSEVVDLNDVEQIVQLVLTILKSPIVL